MKSNEYIVKNENLKQTEITFSNIEVIKDAIKEFAYSNYTGSDVSLNFFGEIDNDFRVIVVIGNSDDENIIFNIELSQLDNQFSFGIFDINPIIPRINNGHLLKFDQDKILHITLEYISNERFNGGCFAKGKLIGTNVNDLKFIGISGDIKNEAFINSLNLDELIISLPELSETNDFYITKFL